MLPRPPVLVPFGTFLALGQNLVAPGAAEVAVRAHHPVVQVCVAPGVAPDAGHQRVRRILGWRRRGKSFEVFRGGKLSLRIGDLSRFKSLSKLPRKLFPW